MIEGMAGTALPVLLTKEHTYKTIKALQEVYGLIEPTDTRKINTALGLFEHYVNGKEVTKRLDVSRADRMTPMMFELNLIERAKRANMRIVLAEGEEPRILQAADILLRREVARHRGHGHGGGRRSQGQGRRGICDHRRRVLPGAGQRIFRHRLWLPLHGVGAAGGERVRAHVHRL